MAKVVPTARSQRYKATHQAQEPVNSIPPKGKIPTTHILFVAMMFFHRYLLIPSLELKGHNVLSPLLTCLFDPYSKSQVQKLLNMLSCNSLLHIFSIALNGIVNPKIATLFFNNNLMILMPSYSLNSKFKMQRFSNLKIRSRKVKQYPTFTVHKL